MKNRWLNLLFALLSILILVLSWHLFLFAKTTAAASLIINLLKPLNILLFLTLFYILVRQLFQLFVGKHRRKKGFRLQTKLVLGILPLTLVPSLFLFFLSTRFLDDILLELVIDPNRAQIIENSQGMSQEYMEDIRALNLKHGPELLEICRSANRVAVLEYLEQYGLQGVTYYREEQLVEHFLGSSFPQKVGEHLSGSATVHPGPEPIIFEDGFLVARFPYLEGTEVVQLLYAQESPFTEHFLYLQDSYVFLKYTQRKTERVKGLNQGILLIATLGIIFGGVWTALAFAKQFLSAFNALIQGAHQVAAGNLETRVEVKTGDEIEDVVLAFNSMIETMKANRKELERKALDLQFVNEELSGQIDYSNTVIHQIGNGLLSTDQDGRIQTFNPAVLSILELTAPESGQLLGSWLDPERHQTLCRLWDGFRQNNLELSQQLELGSSNEGENHYVSCNLVPLSKDDELAGTLVVLDDLTELFNAQKLAAWQEVAKRIAHEIKNPLTPIQLSIQRIRRKARNGAADLKEAIESAHETIIAETDLLKNLVNEFSTFAKMPEPVIEDADIGELVNSVVRSYDQIYQNVRVQAQVPDGIRLACDASQLRQVLINLIQNAANACEDRGEVCLSVYEERPHLVIAVTDNGSGIPMEERDEVFQPYYSKSPKGTGLGLAIVKRIIEDHRGSIQIFSHSPRGTRFEIKLPIS